MWFNWKVREGRAPDDAFLRNREGSLVFEGEGCKKDNFEETIRVWKEGGDWTATLPKELEDDELVVHRGTKRGNKER